MSVYKWLLRYPVAFLASIGIAIIMIALIFLGKDSNFNAGGIISRLFGKEEKPPVDVANTVPASRVDAGGNPIPVEEADEEGWVQQKVDILDTSNNPFRDKSKIILRDTQGNTTKVKLPTGIKDVDIKTVIEVEPGAFKVVLKEGPKKTKEDLIDYLRIIVIFLVFLTPLSLDIGVASALECPKGYKCVTDKEAKEIASVLDLQNCMVEAAENSAIALKWSPNQIMITGDGQVFAEDEVVVDLKWCTWHLELRGKNDVVVYRKEESPEEWGLRLRIKLGLAWMPTYFDKGSFADILNPMLIFEPFYLWDFHPQLYVGLSSFGLGLGMDITQNMDIFAGAGYGYKGADITPVIGISLSFN